MNTVVDAPKHSTIRGWCAVGSVALGIFAVVTAELLPVGLLTPITTDLKVSTGTGGLMVTIPGLVAAATAPLVLVVAGRLDRRIVLYGLMGLLALSNVASATAPDFPSLLASRIVVGICIGGYWATAGSLAVRLVPQRSVPRATAIIFGGVASASVLGVPAGTLLGELGGWRFGFTALAGLGASLLAVMLIVLPTLPAPGPISFRAFPQILRANTGVGYGVGITALLITGHFAAYTFVRPILTDMSGVDAGLVGTLLLGYGLAGIIGNFVAGHFVAKHPYASLTSIIAVLAGTVVTIPILGTTPISGVALLLVWGMAYGGVSVSVQTWMMRAAPKAIEIATAALVTMFNFSIALGAALGGLIVNLTALPIVAWAGGLLAALALVLVHNGRRTVS